MAFSRFRTGRMTGGRDGSQIRAAGELQSRQISPEASVVMQRLPYSTETILSNKINRNRIVLSFEDNPRKPLRRRPPDIIACMIAACIRLSLVTHSLASHPAQNIRDWHARNEARFEEPKKRDSGFDKRTTNRRGASEYDVHDST